MENTATKKKLLLLRILFLFLCLTLLSGILLFKYYRAQFLLEKEYIHQERNVVIRLSYLEKMGRNDFSNYLNLVQQPGNGSILNDSLFRYQFDSISKSNSKYIASFWLLIKLGDETATLDSLNTLRKLYLEELNNFSKETTFPSENSFSKANYAFNTYRNFYQELMNQQYSKISNLLRRSQEILITKIATIIGLMLSCMLFAIIMSWYIYKEYKKI